MGTVQKLAEKVKEGSTRPVGPLDPDHDADDVGMCAGRPPRGALQPTRLEKKPAQTDPNPWSVQQGLAYPLVLVQTWPAFIEEAAAN